MEVYELYYAVSRIHRKGIPYIKLTSLSISKRIILIYKLLEGMVRAMNCTIIAYAFMNFLIHYDC
jgi:hypothetical protein